MDNNINDLSRPSPKGIQNGMILYYCNIPWFDVIQMITILLYYHDND